MTCTCQEINGNWFTYNCQEHDDSPTWIAPHEWGGHINESGLNDPCYYCGYPRASEVHIMEGQTDKLTGKKHDGGKAPIALISSSFIFEVAKVLEFGAGKYDAWNWKGGFKWVRVSSAVLRHIFSWLGGEDKDPETGLSHLAHASCGLMFLIDFEVNKLGEDDRYKGVR